LESELSSDATKVHLGLIRSMAYRDSDGGWRFYTHFNLQTAFERPPDRPVNSYAFVRVGDMGTETPEKLFEWLNIHPGVGPVLDSTPSHMDAYLDGGN
jgi:hypothetical protein